jgi:hypothetical protein
MKGRREERMMGPVIYLPNVTYRSGYHYRQNQGKIPCRTKNLVLHKGLRADALGDARVDFGDGGTI